MNKTTITKNLASAFFCFLSFFSYSQTITTFASGLISPIGITRDAGGNLWVGEAGTGFNDGKIAMIDSSGTVFDVVTGLPSYFDTITFEVSGPIRANKEGNNLIVMIGGSPLPNAGSMVTFDLSDFTPGDPAKTINDATGITQVSQYVLAQGFAESNPYSYAYDGDGNTFIVDAAANAVLKQELSTGNLSVVKTFDPYPNIYTLFPPFIDYVPTKIINNPAGGFYLCNLTGFPFIPGLASVVKMDESGTVSTFTGGLTTLVDLDVDAPTGDVYALQFGMFDTTGPVFNSAKIIRIKTNGDTSTVIGGFGPSPGMVLDGSGGAYVTSLFTGQVLHITNITTGIDEAIKKNDIQMAAYPNPFTTQVSINFYLNDAAPVSLSIVDITGRVIYKEEKFFSEGDHVMKWGGKNLLGKPVHAGMYMVRLSSQKQEHVAQVVVGE